MENQEILPEVNNDSNNDLDEDIFMGSITKSEIIATLKQHNLLTEKLLEPLNNLMDSDVLDLHLVAYYWDKLVNKNTNTSKCLKNNNLEISQKDDDDDDNILEISQVQKGISDDDLQISLHENFFNNIEWSELLKPENSAELEEFENSLLQIQEPTWSESWAVKNLKQIKQFTNSVQNKKFNKTDDNSNTCGEESASTSNFDVSYEKSNLNDTLDEMELLMKLGETYMTRESIVKKPSFKKSLSSPNLNSPKYDYENIYDNISKRKLFQIPIGKENKGASNKSKIPASTTKINESKSEFKLPTFTNNKKSRKPIESPIGLYIKNSPTVPLMKKRTTPTEHFSTFKIIEKNKQILCENSDANIVISEVNLPVKTYKPAARNLFIEKYPEPKIPSNIRKLIKDPLPEVIKHVGRVKSSDDQEGIPSNFQNDADLTEISDSTSFSTINSNQTNNLSLYISKNAFQD